MLVIMSTNQSKDKKCSNCLVGRLFYPQWTIWAVTNNINILKLNYKFKCIKFYF